MLPHQPAKLLAVHHDALVTQRRPNAPIAVTLELVADRADPGDKLGGLQRNRRYIIEGGTRQAHQLAPPADGDAVGPVTTEVFALFGRGACFKAPFSSSISSACRPTIRSRAAILASYSWIRSAACTSSSNAPASNLPTQIRISCREMSCRLDSACSVSPAMNSSATCRLNAALCDRCFVMASILRKPNRGVNSYRPFCPPPGAHSTTGSFFHAETHPETPKTGKHVFPRVITRSITKLGERATPAL